ncbi:hypothetical protein QUF61_08420 [Candidatus Venteria ishoeyi]|uniref:hypothetical protein n=1 Tax=Candidatus Venteria ishoeyi TaxID=1899563 RepID=UPI0025A5ECE0|nr:hypothetical protein [Candidatus Venteria ishoeyi]MDM8546506.1 hypothetical protein [Candidatus Venteria ishoeyi]
MGHSTFSQKYNGRFTSTLRWSQLDDLWTKLRAQPEGWYAYFVSESLPEAPLDSQALDRFIAEVDALLRKDHQHDYCGIVYADSLEKPAMIKIYDPNNLGASCGSSGVKVHPRWLLSQIPPEAIIDDAPTPMNHKRWWQKIFHSSEHA